MSILFFQCKLDESLEMPQNACIIEFHLKIFVYKQEYKIPYNISFNFGCITYQVPFIKRYQNSRLGNLLSVHIRIFCAECFHIKVLIALLLPHKRVASLTIHILHYSSLSLVLPLFLYFVLVLSLFPLCVRQTYAKWRPRYSQRFVIQLKYLFAFCC